MKAKQLPFSSYVEVDFPDLVKRKCEIIRETPELLAQISCESVSSSSASEIHTPDYHLLGCDLQDLTLLHAKLRAAGVDESRPTVLLSECVLTYVPWKKADEVRPAQVWLPLGTPHVCLHFDIYPVPR